MNSKTRYMTTTLSTLQEVQTAQVIAFNDRRIDELKRLFSSFYHVEISTVKIDQEGPARSFKVSLHPGERDWTLLKDSLEGLLNQLIAENMLLRNTLIASPKAVQA